MTVDEHIFAVVQAAADAGAPLRVRLATLFHDLGKPAAGRRARATPRPARELAAAALRRLRYPNELRERVVRIVRFHPFLLGDGRRARGAAAARAPRRRAHVRPARPLGRRPARARPAPTRVLAKLDRVARFRAVVEQELASPHRLSDLAVDGTDLIELGYEPGPGARPRAAASCSTRSSTSPSLQPARDAARARRGAAATR